MSTIERYTGFRAGGCLTSLLGPMLVSIGLMMHPSNGSTDTLSRDELRYVNWIGIEIVDSVTDQCLPNPDVLSTEAELVLRQSSIMIAPSNFTGEWLVGSRDRFYLVIFANGFEVLQNNAPSGLCIGSLTILLQRFSAQPEGHYASAIAYFGEIIGSGPKGMFQSQMRNNVSEFVSKIANEILKARQDLQ